MDRVTIRHFRRDDLVRNCRTITVRVDHQHTNGAIQTWMNCISLTRNVRTNRQRISHGCQELRNAIRATAIVS